MIYKLGLIIKNEFVTFDCHFIPFTYNQNQFWLPDSFAESNSVYFKWRFWRTRIRINIDNKDCYTKRYIWMDVSKKWNRKRSTLQFKMGKHPSAWSCTNKWEYAISSVCEFNARLQISDIIVMCCQIISTTLNKWI